MGGRWKVLLFISRVSCILLCAFLLVGCSIGHDDKVSFSSEKTSHLSPSSESSMPVIVNWDQLVNGVAFENAGLTINIDAINAVVPNPDYILRPQDDSPRLLGSETIISYRVGYNCVERDGTKIDFLVFYIVDKTIIKKDSLIEINYLEYPISELDDNVVYENDMYVVYELLEKLYSLPADEAIYNQRKHDIDEETPCISKENVDWMLEARDKLLSSKDLIIKID